MHVANYGATGDKLFIRVGRSSDTGSGCLWIRLMPFDEKEVLDVIRQRNKDSLERSSDRYTEQVNNNRTPWSIRDLGHRDRSHSYLNRDRSRTMENSQGRWVVNLSYYMQFVVLGLLTWLEWDLAKSRRMQF